MSRSASGRFARAGLRRRVAVDDVDRFLRVVVVVFLADVLAAVFTDVFFVRRETTVFEDDLLLVFALGIRSTP